MRDVTDNRTGELDVEVKRSRGRPRKADAMTNAQRQAAYRARRRQQSVTVTRNAPAPRLIVDQVDAYDECRLEIDALRAELAEAHETIDELNDELLPLRAVNARLADEVAEVNLQFVRLIEERDAAKAAAVKGAAKSVTRNDKGATALCAEIKRSSKYYGQTAAGELFPVSIVGGGEYVVQGGPGGQYRFKDVWLWAVDALGKKTRLG